MLRTLEAFGFEWDGEVLYQSTRRAAYREALDALAAAGRIFACSCSRKDLAGTDDDAGGYPGTCRAGPTKSGPTALRFRVGDRPIHFDDLFLGAQHFDLAACGDVVVQRRDGLPSYQLAVVVDDAFQGVTRVVRGADLLASTPWQIDLQDALSLPQPIYGHLPLLLEPDGAKLSKSRRSLPLDLSAASPGPDFDPYVFIAGPTPGPGRLALLKMCGNGQLRTGAHKRLRARPRSVLSAPGDTKAESTGENCGVQEGVLR